MKLVPTADQQDLASTFRSLLEAHCPTTLVRRLAEPGDARLPDARLPEALWKQLSGAGVLGLALPEEHGGGGGTLSDLGVFCVEAGRALCPSVVGATLLLGLAVDRLGDDAQRARLLPGLAAGQVRGSVALSSAYDAAAVEPTLTAVRVDGSDDEGWEVSGRVDFVSDADLADVLLLGARTTGADDPGRHVAVLVSRDASGLEVEPLATTAGDRLGRVTLRSVRVPSADLLAGAGGPEGPGLTLDEVRRVTMTGRALQCLDMVGGTEAVLDRTVAHLASRHQFGRPIGSFQAAQHLVADMHIAARGARLAALSAAFWLGQGRLAVRETGIAVMQTAAAYRRVTLDAHQLHGGMGYVLETDLHLWSERARHLGVLGGGPDVAAGWLDQEADRA